MGGGSSFGIMMMERLEPVWRVLLIYLLLMCVVQRAKNGQRAPPLGVAVVLGESTEIVVNELA